MVAARCFIPGKGSMETLQNKLEWSCLLLAAMPADIITSHGPKQGFDASTGSLEMPSMDKRGTGAAEVAQQQKYSSDLLNNPD